MKRKSLSRLAKVHVFDSHGGTCWLCHTKIAAGQKWECDHIKPLWLGGVDNESNLAPVHVHCHRTKSARDRTVKAKGDRVRANHLGIKKRGRKFRGWKRMDGTAVYADHEGN